MSVPSYAKPAVRAPWAQNAGPNDLVDPGFNYAAAGWPQSSTPPPRQYFNWVLNVLYAAVRYFCQRGIADWDASEWYQPGAIINRSGNIFTNTGVNNTGVDPTSAGGAAAGWGPPMTSTAGAGDNSSFVATTAFVTGAVTVGDNAQQAYTNSTAGALEADIAAEASVRATNDDAVYASAQAYAVGLTTPLAPKASPALIGVPTTPTASPGDSSQTIASTAFVGTAVTNSVAATVAAAVAAAAQAVGSIVPGVILAGPGLIVGTSATAVFTVTGLVAGATYAMEVSGGFTNTAGNIAACTFVPSSGSITPVGNHLTEIFGGSTPVFCYIYNAASGSSIAIPGSGSSAAVLRGGFTMPGGATGGTFYMATASGTLTWDTGTNIRFLRLA